MSSFDRRTLLMLPLAMAACGFEPVYAPGQTGSALYGAVRVQEVDSANGYFLLRALEERLGRSSAPEYSLSFSVTTRSQGQALTSDNETTRYAVRGTARYVLKQVSTGEIVASGNVENFVSYSATGSTVDTLASERDAGERLMTILADQMTTKLYATTELPS